MHGEIIKNVNTLFIYIYIYIYICLCHLLELRVSYDTILLRKFPHTHRRKSNIELIFKKQGVKMLAAVV